MQQITNILMTIHLIMMQRKIHYISALQLSKPWSFKDTVSGVVHCTESQYIQPIRLVNSTFTFRELAMVLKSITQPLRPAENSASSDFSVALPTTFLAVSFAPNQYCAGLYSYSYSLQECWWHRSKLNIPKMRPHSNRANAFQCGQNCRQLWQPPSTNFVNDTN